MSRRLPSLALTAAFVLALLEAVSCRPSVEGACSSSVDCLAEEVCLSERCQLRQCSTSADCPMESHCEPSTGQCLEGCLQDEDCFYGETCVAQSCEAKKCTSTTLDCSAGQFCDLPTGQCYDAAGPYCAPCRSSEDCGGSYNYCGYVNGIGPFCFPECSSDNPCPAGYDCVSATNSGEIISYYCVALCGYLETLSSSQGREGVRLRLEPLSPSAIRSNP